MTGTLSRRDRNALLGGMLTLAVIASLGRGVPALRVWERERMAAALETRNQLLAAERGAASLPQTRDSGAVREQRLRAAEENMITAASAEAAAAALAAAAEEIADEEGISVGTLTLRPDTVVRSGMARVGVRITAEGDVEGLAGLLHSVESNDTPMFVRELSIAQAEPAAPGNRVEVLRFEVLLVTLARIERTKPRTDARR